MTVITGETGAGRRCSSTRSSCCAAAGPIRGSVRDGADEARVEGRFVIGDGDDEKSCSHASCRPSGAVAATSNGRLATAAELAEAGRALVDLHGQHAHQSLLAPAEQRALLDRAAGDAAFAARTPRCSSARHRRPPHRRTSSRRLGGDERARAREIDLLRYQLAEIDDAADRPGPTRTSSSAAEAEVLADAEAHRDALATAYDALEGAAEDALGRAVGALTGRAPFADARRPLARACKPRPPKPRTRCASTLEGGRRRSRAARRGAIAPRPPAGADPQVRARRSPR